MNTNVKRLLMVCMLAAMGLQGASTQPTATVTLTNLANIVNGATIDVNSDVRTWTNGTAGGLSKWILITNTLALNTTNALVHFQRYAPGGPVSARTNGASATSFKLVGQPGQSLTVTLSGSGATAWGSVSYVTNQWTNSFPLNLPFTSETPGRRTNAASDVVDIVNVYATNRLGTNTTAMGNFTDLLSGQVLSNKTVRAGKVEDAALTNNLVHTSKHHYNPGIYTNWGLIFYNSSTNWGASILSDVDISADPDDAHVLNFKSARTIFPNRVAYGSTYSNYWTTTNRWVGYQYFDVGFLAAGARLNYGTWIGGTGEVALLTVTNLHSGSNATVRLTNLVAEAASLDVTNLTARAIAKLTNITGTAASFDVTNLTARSGSSSNLTHHDMIGSNVWARGTNRWDGGLNFTRYSHTALANGDNAGVVLGTNVYVDFSGYSAAIRIAGFLAEPSGGFHILQFRGGGQTVTVLNDSGLDATPANRIYTLSGSDQSSSGDCAAVVIYNEAQARWQWHWLNRGAGSGSAGVLFDANTFNVDGGTVVLKNGAFMTNPVVRTNIGPAAPVEGQMWNDVTFNEHNLFMNTITQSIAAVLYKYTNAPAYVHSTSQVSILGPGRGSTNLPITFFRAGKHLRTVTEGVVATDVTSAGVLTLRLKFGTFEMGNAGITMPTSLGGNYFRFETVTRCHVQGAGATWWTQGELKVWNGSGFTSAVFSKTAADATSSAVAITVDITAQQSVADVDNKVMTTHSVIEHF